MSRPAYGSDDDLLASAAKLLPGVSQSVLRGVLAEYRAPHGPSSRAFGAAVHALTTHRPVPDAVAEELLATATRHAENQHDFEALERIRLSLARGGSLGEPLIEPSPPQQASERLLSQTSRAELEPEPGTRSLYRIIARSTAQSDDFAANLAKCLPMRGAELQDPALWAGLSMYDTPEEAARTARRFHGRLGKYIAQLQLPTDRDPRLLVRPTLRPGHFTVMCCADLCISFVREVQPIVGLAP